LIFSAGSEAGNLRVTNQPCMTWFDNRLGIERIVINGIEELPEFIAGEKRIVFKNNNLMIDLRYSSMMIEDSHIRIEL
jgi:hypothetical protein